MKIIGISGSLRKESLNTKLLHEVKNIFSSDADFEEFTLENIPLYNGDIEAGGEPSGVFDLKQRIRGADGVIIVSPEYNFSVSGVMKNAIDWISRPPADAPLSGKAVGIMGASTGGFGTMRAQVHLRDILHSLNARVMDYPEIFISRADKKLSQQGSVLDEADRENVEKFRVAFLQWIESVQNMSSKK